MSLAAKRAARFSASVFFVASFAATVCTSAGTPPRAVAAQRDALVPPAGAFFGAQAGPDGDPGAARAAVTSLESELGRRLDIDQHTYAWADAFPTDVERWDLEMGRIPLISWEGRKLSSILNGSQDPLIRSRALGVAALGTPVFLSWGSDMNVASNAWSGPANNGRQGRKGPSRFVAAWQHIHQLFRAEHAGNAVWVWEPSHKSVPRARWNHWSRYYPGDGYVDWVGVHAAASDRHSASLQSMIQPIHDAYAANKPILIEASSSEGADSGWISEAHAALSSMPAVKAFIVSQTGGSGAAPKRFPEYRTLADDDHFNVLFSAGATTGPTPWVNVREVGATGDGSTDDTEAFRSALGAGNRIVYVPTGTYVISSEIAVPSTITMWLSPGATLLAAVRPWDDTGLFRVTDAQHVTFVGGAIDGQKSSNPGGRAFGIMITHQNASDVRILGTTVRDMPGQDESGINGGDGIYIGSGRDIEIDHVLLEGNVRQGISITGSVSDVAITNSVFKSTTGTRPGAGVDIEPDPGNHSLTNIEISGSEFVGNNRGIQLTVNESASASISDVRILGNTVIGNRLEGMLIVGGEGRMRGVQIADNRFAGNGGSGLYLREWIEAVLHSNRIDSNAGKGLRIERNGATVVVESNTITGNLDEDLYISESSQVQLIENLIG